MSVDTDNCNCGPDPVSIEESPSPTVVVDEENLLKMLEEQNKLLETDKRALTRITSTNSTTEGTEQKNPDQNTTDQKTADQKSTDQKSTDQKNGGTVDRKRSIGSATENMEGSLDSPSLGRKATDEEMWELWGVILRDWEENCRKKAKLIRQLVIQGIPEHMRGMAWLCLSGSQNREIRDKYPKLINEVSPFEKQIGRDLARTFPEENFFKERNGLGQESLLNVLKAYSVYDREVGYCQGSPFIVGMLLMQQIPEEEVFCIFIRLMEHFRLREVYKPSMADLGLYFYQLERLIEELLPQLHIHFQAVGCKTSIYASPWFLTLFASSLSLNVAFRIMDIFFLDGSEILFRIAIALLEHHSSTLVKMDLEDMIKFFQKSLKPAHESDPDALITAALKVRYNAKKMKRWERDYITKREKAAQENDELLKLRSENSQLVGRVTELEKECASLADKLIQGQVTRAQEAEERFGLKREVAKLKRLMSNKKTHDSQSDEDNKAEVEREASITSTITENDKEENNDVTDGSDKDTKEPVSPVKSESLEDDSGTTGSEAIPAFRLQSVERELMAAKEEISDAAEQLEQKRKELRESLRREALLLEELQATQLCVQELQRELLAVKKELSDVKSNRSSAGNEDVRLGSPSSPPDNASATFNNFDETGMTSSTTTGSSDDNRKGPHRNNINKKPVVDWV